ncbi:MAG TPA: glycosyltransferase, partial [Xanthobacteraceae bacterium]|nr:glycosyltransferase [Xanthobacteraceae bacterium]
MSVIVVSDYAADDGARTDEFRMMAALASQDIAEPFEIVLAESEARKVSFPDTLLEIAPNTRVAFFPEARSSGLKDAALRAAAGKLVAVFEADAPPQPAWLRLAVEALDRDPAAGAVSGHTIYGEDSALKRVAGLIDRGYLETDKIGPTPFVCNNGALYRRELLEAFPYGDEPNPFVSGRLRSEAIRDAGMKLLFHPGMVSVHEFGGLKFLREVRRNQGFCDGRLAYLARGNGMLSRRDQLSLLFGIMHERLRWETCVCWKAAHRFIRWYDWPAAIGMLLLYRIMEWRAAALA